MRLEEMTLEAKRSLLADFCDAHENCDASCPCYSDEDSWCEHYNHLNISESALDEAIVKYQMIPTNPYWNNITTIANRQREKGIKDYGQGIEANPANVLERINYIEEELVDALMYLEWLKDGVLNGKEQKI